MKRSTKRTLDFSAKKRALLDELLEKEGAAPSIAQTITRRKDADSFVLSFAQQRLWFLDQLEPGSSFYNVPTVISLAGQLNVPALERSLSEIIRRHEVLRTGFPIHDGGPVQVIAPPEPISLAVLDLSSLPDDQRQSESRSLMRQEAQLPFDLANGPVLRASVLRLGAEEHLLLLTIHHIASDAWSVEIFTRELQTLYQLYNGEEDSTLEDLPIQYADYAVWQREWLQGERLEQQLAYWRKQLADVSTLELPTDHARPAIRSYQGKLYSYLLNKNVSEGIKALSQRSGVTLFMTLLAAFQLLLSRYSRQSDIVVGTPIAGRTRSETESLIGFFINTLVLRTDCSGDPTFTELLGRVREVCLGAYAHQDVPFEKLVEELEPERDLSHNPLFQVMFALQNASRGQAASDMSGLKVRAMPVDSQNSVFDLTLMMQESEDGLGALVQYNTDLFEADTITRLLKHFEHLLEGIVAAPESRLSQLPLLSQEERHHLLVQWNDTSREYPKDKCIHELFEEQTQRTPDALALVFADEQLSYHELNERANQLAHHLRSLGVMPDSLVGIALPRSVQMVVALLGILKAGGAYLPLDTAYPQERLSFMLDDAQARVLITSEELLPLFASQGREIVCLERDAEAISNQPTTNLSHSATAEHLAYVIYTSGSTGIPKGVSIPHRGVVRLVKHNYFASLTTNDVMLQLAPISFDASTFELWGALLNGARLILFPDFTPSLEELGEFIQNSGVTTLWLTAGLFHQMVEEQSGKLGGVRQLLAGGDVLSPSWVKKYLECASSTEGEEGRERRIINGYGPTENTTFTTCHVMGEAVEVGERVSIGKAIGNTRVYVLDEYLEPVPVGVAGELYIGGDGLARGYLNRAELTAERFVPHPFSTEAGARLYRTGDLVKYLPSGDIEFIGRIDQQVKVRGFRIELGEIEAVLLSSAAVRDCVVLAREDMPGDRRLVAYVVAEIEQEVTSGELRSYLKERLPEYMIPSLFVQLEELPLTPNGKVNRRALPAPDGSRPDLQDLYVEPQTPVQEILAAIWREVLNVERVGINDNFFALGGHSLKATQVMSRVRQACAVELPLRSMFASPTVKELSEEVESRRAEGPVAGEAEVELKAVEKDGELPLSFAQQRLWLIDKLESGTAAYNVPAALRLAGELNIVALEHSLSEIVRRHEVLRTSFHTADGQPVQVIAESQPLSVPVIDLSGLMGDELQAEAQRRTREESARPFDLEVGPLFRATLLRLAPDEHVLLLTMHHIVSDGWSLGVLTRELSALYEAYKGGQASPLEELPIQYADYAVWQRKWLQGEVLQRQLQYWKQHLGGAPAVLELPTDHPRPAMQSFKGALHSFTLSAEVSDGLKALSQRSGVTLFMTLLAAFQLLLSRYSRQSDIVVGTPIAGRTRSETESLIGFFINTLVLRTDCSGDPTFTELLGRVREVCLGAYAHQDVPFEKLVEELEPERDLSHNPLFQVMFALQNAPRGALQLSGLQLSPVSAENGTEQFDLTLGMMDRSGVLSGALSYNTEMFEAETMRRMGNHLGRLLESIVAGPEQRVSGLELLSEEERQQVLFGWNETGREYGPEKCVHQLFEEQAERSPHAVALVYDGRQLTYLQLNERSNQLAHRLRKMEVGPDVLVGISMERSVEMVVGLLGILKAGGAYLPLDPEYPQERLAFMLKDAGVSVLLSQSKLVGRLPEDKARVICVDTEWEVIAREDKQNPRSGVSADHLAYVIYTSGSTGQPKGVMIHHRGISNRLQWMQEAYQLDGSDRVLQKTPFSFDVSVWEFFWPLMAGARLIVARPGGHQDNAYLVKLIAEEEITTLHFVPPMLKMFLEEKELESWRCVRQVMCSGEALPIEAQDLFFKSSEAELHNLYGPTEASVDVTSWACKREAEQSSVPIGWPIANMQMYVLDPSGQPVPAGIVGELHIGGVGLGRGYLNRPALTAERFIPHPFGAEPGTRLYRTGDLGRHLPDGSIEFTGRLDYQVKIRGFRIELGEIEAALASYTSVRDCIVLAREDEPGDKRLVAYLVVEAPAGETESAVAINELRNYLKTRLPEYMIPGVFMQLDEIPLTLNGKVDRRALPAPDGTRPELEDAFAAPRTPLEELLAGIWADVLDLDQVGIHDNFFDLGGHSMFAMIVIARLHDELNVELPLRTIFESPTVAEFAVALVQSLTEQEEGQELTQMLEEIEQMSDGDDNAPESVKIATAT